MILATHRALASTIAALTIASALACGCKSKRAPDADKLVIVKAVWGDFRNGQTADVTPIVAKMAKNNALSIQATSGLLGDPASMMLKQLLVEWGRNGKVAKKHVSEGETLTIRADEEPSNHRLVVRKAVYGSLATGKTIDVTKNVSDMVVDNSLSVVPNNGLFGDPAENQFKQLQVDCTFDGVALSKTVDEYQTLKIPETAQ